MTFEERYGVDRDTLKRAVSARRRELEAQRARQLLQLFRDLPDDGELYEYATRLGDDVPRCLAGHPLVGENIRRRENGKIRCRKCHNAAQAKWEREKRRRMVAA